MIPLPLNLRLIAYAGALLAVLGLGWYLYHSGEKSAETRNALAVAALSAQYRVKEQQWQASTAAVETSHAQELADLRAARNPGAGAPREPYFLAAHAALDAVLEGPDIL